MRNKGENYCWYCMEPILNEKCEACGSNNSTYQSESHHLQIGTILTGRYLVGAVLGEGGFGITYIGRDTNLDIKVAIKEYYPSGIVNRNNNNSANIIARVGEAQDFFEKGKTSFLKEARTLAKFSNEPNIVAVRDFFSENNTAYIVMEYLEGIDLKDYIKKNGILSFKQSVDMLSPIMMALSKIHKQGLIHRDISPANIMLLKDGTVKLLDFGASRDVSGEDEKSLSIFLKPGYAPEEQYRTKGHQGPWTDVYALSGTMYKMMTGVTPDDAMNRIFSDELKKISQINPLVTPEQEEIIFKGMAIHKENRYKSVKELYDDCVNDNIQNSDEQDDEKTIRGFTNNKPPVCGEVKEITKVKKTNVDDIKKREHQVEYISKDIKEVSVNETPEITKVKNILDEKKKDKENKVKKSKKKKSWGMVVLSAIVVIVFIIGISTIFNALNNITICGEKISKNQTSLYLNNKTLTETDMKNIISMSKLEKLDFTSCIFEEDVINYLGEIASLLNKLSIDSCSGIKSYKSLSQLKYLTDLEIINCGLTNEQLNEIELKDKDYLTWINFTGNSELSDLSKLVDISDSLTQLFVSGTSVVDFTSLKECKMLGKVEAIGNGIKDISTLTNETIIYLILSDNNITDISTLENFEYLEEFNASRNDITDISAMKNCTYLNSLELEDNKISDISALANCEKLRTVNLNKNQVTSLEALFNCKKLAYLYVSENNLKNLSGLEQAIELKYIEASKNQISNINSLSGSTLLERVVINDNEISDISVLSKSSSTIEYLDFSNNNVSDISALEAASALQYLYFNNNNVITLDVLKNAKILSDISAENNQIESIDGLVNSSELRRIYLSNNRIESMSVIANLQSLEKYNLTMIDLSNNNISDLVLSTAREYTFLALYNNPLNSLDQLKNYKGTYLSFTYIDDMDLSGLKGCFKYYEVVDCPSDKQIEVRDSIDNFFGMTVSFITHEEANKTAEEKKSENSEEETETIY